MSISTDAIGANGGFPLSQKAVPRSMDSEIDGALPAFSAAIAKADLAGAPPVQPVVDAKEGEFTKPGARQVQQSLEDINKMLSGFSISVQFKVDADYKELIIKVVDQDTGKLIRQIPVEDVVKMSKAMDNLKGLLFAQSV